MFEKYDEFALINKWQHIKNVPFEKFGIRIDKSKQPLTRKNDDVFKLLMFLKLLPTPRQSFEKGVKNLLIYTEVILILSKCKFHSL